ncbi:YsnF/AvaK domain-containing protein [Pantoea sp. MQR6]|uniref:YsnF/AvaK domain-containing protein n=1 Tax=Pantoea sp. MQR6 TaxID=2907307 RepID=UPI001FA94A22|nr:YsnF/AvaK domain-containing protein [Pantoea sp. MQR6]
MAHEKIVTMFSNTADAEGAKRSLLKAGFDDNDIDVISGDRLNKEEHEARHPGLWQRLFGDTVDEEQAEVYEDALRTGGVVLTLRADEEQLPRALSIIDAHDSGNMQQYGEPGLSNDTDIQSSAGVPTDELYTGEVQPTGVTPVRTSLTGDETEEEVLRLAEERLEVGKRLVSEGSTRVRRYTVTDDVSKEVSLHEQHADIFRRPLTQHASPDDVDWSEKTVEVAETHELPVINKTVQVKEEVVVRTDQSERVETVNDSVRRQEVDIDHAGAVKEGEESPLPDTVSTPVSPTKDAEQNKVQTIKPGDELTIQKNKFDEKF